MRIRQRELRRMRKRAEKRLKEKIKAAKAMKSAATQPSRGGRQRKQASTTS